MKKFFEKGPFRFYWIRLSVLSVIFFFIWGAVFAVLVSSGALWAVTGERLERRPDYALQAALFHADKKQKYDAVVFGDPEFVKAAQQLFADKRVLYLTVPKLRLSHAAAVLSNLKSLKFGYVILQQLPFYWTTINPTVPNQRLDIWSLSNRGLRLAPSGKTTKVFWKTLRDWAKVKEEKPGKNPNNYAVDSLQNATFRIPPQADRGAVKTIRARAKSLKDKLIWIVDVSRLPPDTPPGLLSAFDRALTEERLFGEIGRHVTLQDAQTIVGK